MRHRAALLAAITLGGIGGVTRAAPPPAPPTTAEKPAEAPKAVEVCFVIDTTGSMQQLIDSAKAKIWTIANDLVREGRGGSLKMALVGYRDRGDEYVTKVVDMTEDLDALYKALMAFKADGGGDGPESVNAALHEAVEKVSWTKTPAMRIIFLVGDAVPHMDYADDVKWPETIEKAAKMNIIVDTIQCGADTGTANVWQEMAKKGHGVYIPINTGRSELVIATPQDKKILELNAELAKTVVPYGNAAQQTAVTEKAGIYRYMSSEAALSRASVNNIAGGKAVQGAGDLVQDMQSDPKILQTLKPEELPSALAAMSADERKAYLDEQLARRTKINDEIAKLSKERAALIAAEETRLAAAAAAAAPPGSRMMGAGGIGGGGAGGRGGFGDAVRAGASDARGR